MNEDELQKIDNEWRALEHINLSFVQDTEEFWKGIGKISQADDTPAFPKLSKFVNLYSKHFLCNTLQPIPNEFFLKLIWSKPN